MSASPVTTELRAAVIALAKQAGAAIMDVYAKPFEVTPKSDASPLTQADLRSHQIIHSGLQSLAPQHPILSEESAITPFVERSKWRTYWLVDPLDGTKEFVSRNGEFTVNIALIRDNAPIFGVVYAPASSTLYVGAHDLGAHKQIGVEPLIPIRAQAKAPERLRVVGSRS